MSLNVTDARLDVYLPGNTSRDPANADVQIAEADFEQMSIGPRIQNLIDTGEIVIRNRNGQYTDGVRSGARLEVYTQIGSESSLSHTWTGVARNVTYDELGALDARIKLDVDDFVFGLMDMREVVGAFQDRRIAGPPTALLNTLLRRKTPEIDRTRIQSFPDEETVVYNGLSLLDAARNLSRRVNALMWSDGTSLHFEELGTLTPEFTLTESDRGLASNTVNDDQLVNRLRVYGAYDTKLEREVTGFSSWATVTSDPATRRQVQISTRKSEVAKVEIYTDRVANSADDLVVRLHPNNPGGSGPVAPNDPESDYARRRLSQEFISQDGWTTFLLPDHKLVNPNPWILVECTGEDGQKVGLTTNGALMRKHYYPFPTDMIKQDGASVMRYRRREGAHLKQELNSRQALSDYVNAILNKTGKPDKEYQFPAESERTHNLEPGDIVTVPESPRLDAGGDHIVSVVDHEYDGSRLHTNVTLTDTETV